MEKQTNSCMPGKGWKWLLIDDIGRPLIMLRGVYWSSSLERDDDVCPSTVFAWMGLTGGVCCAWARESVNWSLKRCACGLGVTVFTLNRMRGVEALIEGRGGGSLR